MYQRIKKLCTLLIIFSVMGICAIGSSVFANYNNVPYLVTNSGIYKYTSTATPLGSSTYYGWNAMAKNYSGIPVGISVASNTTYLITTMGVYKYGTSNSWEALALGYLGTPTGISVYEGIPYLATSTGVYKYANSSWSVLATGYSGNPVGISVADNIPYLATSTGVYKYTNSSWSAIASGYSGIPVGISVSGSTIYLATNSGAYKYITSWSAVSPTTVTEITSSAKYGTVTNYYTGTNYSGTPLGISVSNNIIYLATTSGVYEYVPTTISAGTYYGWSPISPTSTTETVADSSKYGSTTYSYTGASYSGTPKGVDQVKPPTAITLTAVSNQYATVDLTWTGGADSATFEVFRDGVSIGYKASGFQDTGLKNVTTYSYYVKGVNTAGTVQSNPVSVTTIADNTPPTVNITANTTDITNASSIIYTMQFSEAVTGVAINDITVSNGIKGTFTAVDGDTYTLVVTNSGSCSQTVSIGAGVCTDIAGNNNIAGSKAITVDRTPPTGIISYNPATATISNVVATLTPSETVTVTNPSSGATTYTFSTNGSFTFAFKDAVGNTGSAIATVSNIDRTAPAGNLTINSGNPYTNSTNVTLYPSASDNAGGSGMNKMRFSNDNSTWSSWANYSASGYAWTLTEGYGSKTVYVQYSDNVGNTSISYSRSITFVLLPTVTTQAVTNITQTTATANGILTVLGVPSPTAYGFVWNTTGNPTTGSSNKNLGGATTTGAYTADMTGLSAGTTYYVRAYATNSAGTVYGTQVQFATLTLPPNVTRTVTISGASSGRARVQLSWPAVTGAANYRIWIFDGGSYRVHDIGNVTSWDSDAAKIYPTATQLAAWDGTTDPFRWDGTGQSFHSSWNEMYAKVPGGSYTTWSYYNWIHVAALNSEGNASGSGPWQPGVTSACSDMPDADATNMPNAPKVEKIAFDSISLSAEAVTDRYMTANYPGSGVKGYIFINETTGTKSEITGTSYKFTGLTPNTAYLFKVQAMDNNGNYSSSLTTSTETSGFTTCNEYGTVRAGVDTGFATATVTVDDLDKSGNYSYCGIDIGVFKKQEVQKSEDDQTNWPTVYIERKLTNNLILKITDFGDVSKYKSDEVYTLGYRTLYTTINSASDVSIIETEWNNINNSYFMLTSDQKAMIHDQRIYYGNKNILVSDPDKPNIQNPDELNIYNGYKTFVDGDYVTYVLGFDLSSNDKIDKLKINLNFNVKKENGTNVDGVTLKLLTDKIKFVNKDTNSECNLSSMSISPSTDPIYSNDGNIYTLTIDKSSLKGTGYYNLEYTCQLSVPKSTDGGDAKIKNVGIVELRDNKGELVETKGYGPKDKNWIITNLYTRTIHYR